MLARSASMSFARPVSIISAPAPTVTMTAAGTPIFATCRPRPRRPVLRPQRRRPRGCQSRCRQPRPAGGGDLGARRPTASSTDPCHARKSSSGPGSGGAAGATGAPSGADASARDSSGTATGPNEWRDAKAGEGANGEAGAKGEGGTNAEEAAGPSGRSGGAWPPRSPGPGGPEEPPRRFSVQLSSIRRMRLGSGGACAPACLAAGSGVAAFSKS